MVLQARMNEPVCMKHSVLIVEADPAVRTRVALALRAADDLSLVGEADDLGSGMALLHALRPDVLWVDLGLPDGTGMALVREAALNVPHCDVMVATQQGNHQHVQASLDAGACACVFKGLPGDDMAALIRELCLGKLLQRPLGQG